MKQLLGSNAFNLAVTCNSCSWLNNHVVAAMMSGWCRYISSTIILRFHYGGRYDFPFYGIVLCYLCVQCRECQRRVCIRAIEVYPENFHIWLNFIFAKITDFAFRINKKGYICMSEIENSRVIGIECFLKDEIFFLYSYFYKVITGCLITGLIK